MTVTSRINGAGLKICPALRGVSRFTRGGEISVRPEVAAGLPHLHQRFLSDGGCVQLIQTNSAAAPRQAFSMGVLFSGGPAPGGHNVVAGIFDYLQDVAPGSKVLGFQSGVDGVLKNKTRLITAEDRDCVINAGGFDLLRTSRTKLEKPEQFANCQRVLEQLSLSGLVIIGGDDSNTNAAYLADYLLAKNSPICIIGVPKTIDGDLAFPPYLPVPFGFHTAARFYADAVRNVCVDSASAGKLWHFIKLMGRSASWLTLEAALHAKPHVTLIGEEVKAKSWTLQQVVENIYGVIRGRYQAGKKYGVVLIPEGIVEFIPEIKSLISKINEIIDKKIGRDKFKELSLETRKEQILVELDEKQERLFVSLPKSVQNGLLAELDPSGNVQVSKIPLEELLIDLVTKKLLAEKTEIQTQPHFFGYEARCAVPTIFDAHYTYNLGLAAASLIANGLTGYLAAISNLAESVSSWQPLGLSLLAMMQSETRKGKESLVIGKHLIGLDEPAFRFLVSQRDNWAMGDEFLASRPRTFEPTETEVDRPFVLTLRN